MVLPFVLVPTKWGRAGERSIRRSGGGVVGGATIKQGRDRTEVRSDGRAIGRTRDRTDERSDGRADRTGGGSGGRAT